MEPKYIDRCGSVVAFAITRGMRGLGVWTVCHGIDGSSQKSPRDTSNPPSGGKGKLSPRFALAVALLLPSVCHADIFSFVDEFGITHFSNVPQDQRYRTYLRTADVSASLRGLRAAGSTGLSPKFAQHVSLFGAASQVSPALIHAVISAESGNNPNARSPKGAMGLMQLMPATAQRYQVNDPYDPAQNIRGGVSYLRDLMRQFDNNLPLVLAAYNAGEGAVQRHGNRIPPFAETRQYVPRVLDLYGRYLRDKRTAMTDVTPNDSTPERAGDNGTAGVLP